MLLRNARYITLSAPSRPGSATSLPKLTSRLQHHASSTKVSEALSSDELKKLLSESTWDVRRMSPTALDLQSTKEVAPAQLHHLLRLSALPQPANQAEEQSMLSILHSQLHFVRQIQRVETAGIETLVALRDETQAAQAEDVIGLDAMKQALAQETVVGRKTRRIRRGESTTVSRESKQAEDWDALDQAPKRVGRFFVVDSSEV